MANTRAEQEFFNKYLENCDFEQNRIGNVLGNNNTLVSGHMESRARKADVTEALRFRIHDPLWMLARQWQLGEFRGNDAGTAMSVRCHVASANIKQYHLGVDRKLSLMGMDNQTPLEPIVERIDREITPLVRVESAAYLMSLIAAAGGNREVIAQYLRKAYGLSKSVADPRGSLEHAEIQSFTASRNTRLQRFNKAFSSKAFDGYAIYRDLRANKLSKEIPQEVRDVIERVKSTYVKWFGARYLPAGRGGDAWNQPELGYDFSAENPVANYDAKDYSGGRVSWYSFDVDSINDSNVRAGHRRNVDRETIDTLPVLATYAGAPNKRLWEFENRAVFMGNSTDMQAKGNVVFMQYATMYGNDWMLCPLKTEIGKYIEVESIEVYDTFGIRTDIVNRAGQGDKDPKTFGQRWQMFTNAPVKAETYDNMRNKKWYANGLLFPPALLKTLEGESLEEVSLLRDEMANMVWGVETRIEDGCGSSLDASLLAAEVGQYMEDKYDEAVEKATMTVEKVKKEKKRLSLKRIDEEETVTEVTSSREADYKYSLMNTVPLNWIPFVPQHLFTKEERAKYDGFQGCRETILRRGKMPYFFDGEYRPVRPLSSILKVVKDESRKNPDGSPMEVPMFINEEQVQGVGTIIRKNCQRSRWLDGQTYTWMGYSKGIKHTQGVSGLEFDNLLDPTR